MRHTPNAMITATGLMTIRRMSRTKMRRAVFTSFPVCRASAARGRSGRARAGRGVGLADMAPGAFVVWWRLRYVSAGRWTLPRSFPSAGCRLLPGSFSAAGCRLLPGSFHTHCRKPCGQAAWSSPLVYIIPAHRAALPPPIAERAQNRLLRPVTGYFSRFCARSPGRGFCLARVRPPGGGLPGPRSRGALFAWPARVRKVRFLPCSRLSASCLGV